MPVRFTPLMKKRLSRRALEMIERSLRYFPELDGKPITVGYTRKHLGSASVVYRRGAIVALTIRLKVRKLTFQTIGHELIHLVQGLARGERPRSRRAAGQSIPSGEKQCDIWTLARHPLFCDDAPSYLRLPRLLREHWSDYAELVRGLCLAAITQRTNRRRYIQWLEARIKALAARKRPRTKQPRQLSLPFE